MRSTCGDPERSGSDSRGHHRQRFADCDVEAEVVGNRRSLDAMEFQDEEEEWERPPKSLQLPQPYLQRLVFLEDNNLAERALLERSSEVVLWRLAGLLVGEGDRGLDGPEEVAEDSAEFAAVPRFVWAEVLQIEAAVAVAHHG